MPQLLFGALLLGEADVSLPPSETEPRFKVPRYPAPLTVTVSDSVPDMRFLIHWNQLSNGLLIADRPLLGCISWADLDNMGLVDGLPVEVDGSRFKLRIPNRAEWMQAVSELGDADATWHWSACFTWLRQLYDDPRFATVVGRDACDTFAYFRTVTRARSIGFRPVLEREEAELA